MLVRTLEKKPERGILSSVSSAEMSRINIIILLVDLCILTSISGAPGRSRIVNGEIALVGEFPFVAELKLDGYFRCGGLIYNANYVITSAICVNGYSASKLQVVVAQNNLNLADPAEQTLSVSNIRIHENFQLTNYKNNIALLRVSPSMTFSSYVDFIRIGQVDLSLPANGTLMGWGSQLSGGVTSAILLKKTFAMSTLAGCGSYGADFDPNTMICAGQGSDACTGDAGSPLIQVNSIEISTQVSTSTSSTSSGTSFTSSSTISEEPTSSSTSPCSTVATQSSTTATTTQTTTTFSSTSEAPVTTITSTTSTDPEPFADFVDECDPTTVTQSATTDPPPRSFDKLFDTSVVVGIVSHNKECGNALFPTIFTNLAVYANWLATNAGPQN